MELELTKADGVSDALLEELNSLGFALTGGAADTASSFTLTRFALGHHLFLTIEAVGPHRWLIGMDIRTSRVPSGELDEPRIPFALGRFGVSPDGVRLELSSEEVERALPKLLGDGILPFVDSSLWKSPA